VNAAIVGMMEQPIAANDRNVLAAAVMNGFRFAAWHRAARHTPADGQPRRRQRAAEQRLPCIV
jgi:hypothetical protein